MWTSSNSSKDYVDTVNNMATEQWYVNHTFLFEAKGSMQGQRYQNSSTEKCLIETKNHCFMGKCINCAKAGYWKWESKNETAKKSQERQETWQVWWQRFWPYITYGKKRQETILAHQHTGNHSRARKPWHYWWAPVSYIQQELMDLRHWCIMVYYIP